MLIQLLFFISCITLSPASLAQTFTPALPNILAKQYLLLDYDSGQILLEKDADVSIEPASLTKLMTAYLVFNQLKEQRLSLKDTVKVSSKAHHATGSRMHLETNRDVTVEQLIQGMIVQSGNDATLALAEKIAGSEEQFVVLMNERGKVLGMNNTHFTNSTGLPDPNHRSTARDLSKVAVAIIRDFPEYYHWYSQREFTYNKLTQLNRNILLEKDKTVDGIKTGHTDAAGFCLIASAKRDTTRLISVVLGTQHAEARANESQKLLEYGFATFETHLLYAAQHPISKRRVRYGEQDEVALGMQKNLYVTIPKGKRAEINATLFADKSFKAPITAGQICGKVRITLQEKILEEQPIVALHTVALGDTMKQVNDYVNEWFNNLTSSIK